MRVAVIVHNDVLKDARVIKEARALHTAGFEVEIHGISKTGEPVQTRLPNSEIGVFLVPRESHAKPLSWAIMWSMSRLVSIGARVAFNAAVAIAIVAPAILVWLVADGFQSAARAACAGLTALILAGAMWQARDRLVAMERNAQEFLTWATQVFKNKILAMRAANNIHSRIYEATVKALHKSIKSRPKPDVVHIHDHVGLIRSGELKSKLNCKIVWDAHEIYEDLAANNPERGRLNAAIIASHQHVPDGFITINESIADFYRQNYTQLPKAAVIMNAATFQNQPTYDGRLHHACNLPRTQKILLFQGGFGPKRGLKQLIEAAYLLPSEWSLVMMGWGSLEEELKVLSKTFRRAHDVPAVVFIPAVPQEELQAWSAGASLGAIPYENTGLNHLYCTPNKLWEFPAAGVPILCTDLVEMSKIVKTHEIGFLMPRDFSAVGIADSVSSLTDEHLADARQACRKFIAANNWSTYEPVLVGLYQRLSNPQTVTRNENDVALVNQCEAV